MAKPWWGCGVVQKLNLKLFVNACLNFAVLKKLVIRQKYHHQKLGLAKREGAGASPPPLNTPLQESVILQFNSS